MKSTEKQTIIESLTEHINRYNHFYLTDIGELNAADTNNLRRVCFKQNIKLMVVKNTLLRQALENSRKETGELFDILKGNTSVMFSEDGNSPARLIKEFRKKYNKPILKGAFVQESVYIGDDQLDTLIAVKSKNELIADLVALLKSPMSNVLSQLQSGGNLIHGVLKTLGEKE